MTDFFFIYPGCQLNSLHQEGKQFMLLPECAVLILFIILIWVTEAFEKDERLIALIDWCASPPPPLASGQLEVIMDRRLMQDDNRGLGQGLKDNKKTSNRFRLLLERRMTGNKVRKMRAGVLIQNYTAPLCWLMNFQTLCSSHCDYQHLFSCSLFLH